MAKPATQSGDTRGINPSGAPAQFLQEEAYRGRLPSGNRVTPRPTFVQPDTGTHNVTGGSLDIAYNIAARPMHIGNQEKDLNGGLY